MKTETWAMQKVGNNYDQWMIYAENDARSSTIATVNGRDNAVMITGAPMLQEMAETLRGALDDWPEFDDDDEPVSGADLVEWFGNYRAKVRAVLRQWEAL